MTTPPTDDTVPHHEGAPDTAPALNPPTWTGRKTAVAAALAIGFSAMGTVAAAAAIAQQGAQGPQGPQGPQGRISPEPRSTSSGARTT